MDKDQRIRNLETMQAELQEKLRISESHLANDNISLYALGARALMLSEALDGAKHLIADIRHDAQLRAVEMDCAISIAEEALTATSAQFQAFLEAKIEEKIKPLVERTRPLVAVLELIAEGGRCGCRPKCTCHSEPSLAIWRDEVRANAEEALANFGRKP